MIIVANRMPISEGYEDDFLGRFRNRAGLVDDTPGFVRNLVMEPLSHPHEADHATRYHVVLTLWESEEAFWNWTRSDAFEAAHADRPPPEMFAGDSVLEMHRVVLDSADDD